MMERPRFFQAVFLLVVWSVAPSWVFAEEAEEAEEAVAQEAPAADDASAPAATRLRLDPVYVIGDRPGDLAFTPGSAAVVTEEQLRLTSPYSASEVLRTVPGLHVVEEEGFGLRPNFGMRGLDPDRSRSVLVLEDGIPIALAPYGEPEMYYAPPIERMREIEVVKGSGSILHGPQTIGGVINYLTLDPPDEFRTTLELRLGSYDYRMLHATVGDTLGQVGYIVHAMHGTYEGPRALDLRVNDVMTKFRLALSERAVLTLKLNFYDEVSSATYVGLTTPQYETNPRFNFAIYDRLPVRRYSASTGLSVLLSDQALLQVTTFGSVTSRDWRRQDFDRAPTQGRAYERSFDGAGSPIADTDSGPADGSAIYFRDSTGSRNRTFEVAGVETRLTLDWGGGAVWNELSAGMRYLYERTIESRVDGTHARSTSGTLREYETREGQAVAAWLQNRVLLLDERLRLTPGLRVESLWSNRTIHRNRVDNVPVDHLPLLSDDTHTLALIPGFGLSFDLMEDVVLFAGVHRGFAPPRTKDAVDGSGTTVELDAEYSMNYEVGVRLTQGGWLGMEVAGFMLDFTNQIIPPSQSSGVVDGAPPLVNSGESRHVGVEAAATLDAATLLEAGFRLPLSLSYTFVQSEFGDGWSDDISGNRLPYAPQHQLSGRLGFVHPLGLSAQVSATHIGERFSDRLEIREVSPNGQVGLLEAYTIVDARLGYHHDPTGLGLYVGAKNLLDAEYIASRRPQGIMPGQPRELYVGIRGEF